MTLNYSRNNLRRGGTVLRRLGSTKRGIASFNVCRGISISCPSVTMPIYRDVRGNRGSLNVLIYNANVNVSLTTGGRGNVHTTYYDRRFSTGCAQLRGSSGILYLNNEIVNINATLRLYSLFMGARFRNNHRRGEVSGMVTVRGG